MFEFKCACSSCVPCFEIIGFCIYDDADHDDCNDDENCDDDDEVEDEMTLRRRRRRSIRGSVSVWVLAVGASKLTTTSYTAILIHNMQHSNSLLP